MKPNLFKYATSELSQDAFICWLLEWAKLGNKKIDEPLHKIGISLINRFFEINNIPIPKEYKNIEIKKQYKKIDVLCIINNEYAIIIEDKTNTKNHSAQLKKYFDTINKDYSTDKILLIYFKTGDQDNYKVIEQTGYKLFLRKDFLNILNSNYSLNIKNEIFNDYKNQLQNIEDKRNSHLTKTIDKWYHDSWIGFFISLQKELGEGGWNYVPNPSGGFMGFWWHWKKIDGGELYLQIEQKKLCFKVHVSDKNNRRIIRNKTFQRIIKSSKKVGINLSKPKRFGNGTYMTVAVLDNEYRITDDNNKIDIKQTVENIKEIEKVIDNVE